MRWSTPVAIRILSHNIRYATEYPFRGEERWVIRRPKITNELRFSARHNAETFICLQEVLYDQLIEILGDLNLGADQASPLADWTYIGVGREDGQSGGEYSPILYRRSIWKLKDLRTIWLSKTPDRPSKSWDAASTRILTIGVFQHITSKKSVVAMNTHLDDQGAESRYEGAKIILDEIKKYCSDTMNKAEQQTPVFLAGDFNSEPNQEAYQLLNRDDSLVKDLCDLVAEKDRYGHCDTFTGFGFEKEPKKRIDFLFLGPRQAVEEVEVSTTGNEMSTQTAALWGVEGYSILESRFDDGIYNSDHRAVVGDVYLK
ncbi:MAG: hypothetical protein M1812_001322 [Candelaria pacifica]|nr:MAG: hypothetical protein M1812_001322 [Candelaria pacifica]